MGKTREQATNGVISSWTLYSGYYRSKIERCNRSIDAGTAKAAKLKRALRKFDRIEVFRFSNKNFLSGYLSVQPTDELILLDKRIDRFVRSRYWKKFSRIVSMK